MKNININGIEKYYYADKNGDIYSKYYGDIRKMSPNINRYGYKKVNLRQVDGNARTIEVHRIIYLVFNGFIPQDKVVDHINNDKLDNRSCNLNIVTFSENVKKGWDSGRHFTDKQRSACINNGRVNGRLRRSKLC